MPMAHWGRKNQRRRRRRWAVQCLAFDPTTPAARPTHEHRARGVERQEEGRVSFEDVIRNRKWDFQRSTLGWRGWRAHTVQGGLTRTPHPAPPQLVLLSRLNEAMTNCLRRQPGGIWQRRVRLECCCCCCCCRRRCRRLSVKKRCCSRDSAHRTSSAACCCLLLTTPCKCTRVQLQLRVGRRIGCL